jgi:hypothetical protein
VSPKRTTADQQAAFPDPPAAVPTITTTITITIPAATITTHPAWRGA